MVVSKKIIFAFEPHRSSKLFSSHTDVTLMHFFYLAQSLKLIESLQRGWIQSLISVRADNDGV